MQYLKKSPKNTPKFTFFKKISNLSHAAAAFPLLTTPYFP